MFFKSYTYLFFFLLASSILHSQQQVEQAKKIFESKNYSKALDVLNAYPDIDKNENALQLRGLCHYKLNQLNKAILDFTASKKLGNDSPDLFLKMGQCKQHQKSFEEAIFFYKSFLAQAGDNHKDSYKAYNEIKNSLYSATSKDSSGIQVQNFGEYFNSPFNEIQITQSPRFGNVYYLSSDKTDGKFKINAHKIDSLGKWSVSNIKSGTLNTELLIQDISANGNSLLYQQKTQSEKQLIVSSFYKNEELLITLPENLVKDACDFQIVNRNTLSFSSNRKGGYGGYDIYTVSYENGHWKVPVNLGPFINSSHDERTPFLSSDLNTLYFSSNRPYCHGGFDQYLANNVRTKADIINLGSNINSTGDDLGFKICTDGQMAVFYSNRKSGYGGFDAYFTNLQDKPFQLYADSLDLEFVQDAFNKILYDKLNESVAISPDEPTETRPQIITNPSKDKTESTFKPAVPPSEFQHIILYQDKLDLLNNINKAKMDHWILYLKENQDLNIKLLAYTDESEPGLPEFVQYNTLKRALILGDYLLENEISEKRIQIESLAYNFPVVKKESAGKKNTAYEKYNKRIDLELTDSSGQTLSSFVLNEYIPRYAYDRRHELFISVREGLYYSIEIVQTNRLFKNAVLRLYDDIYVRKENMSSENRYYIGIYTNQFEAQQLQKELSLSSSPYAKLVAFYNGARITKNNIGLLLSEYPELESFQLD